VTNLNIGDKVIVNSDIELVQEDEELLIGKEAIVTICDDWIFPVEVKFLDENIQQVYEDLGIRRFDMHELTKVI
jgi:hypothetical protein